MKIIFLCAFMIVGIDGKISVTKVVGETNPELATAVTRVEPNSEGVGTLSVDLEILKTVDGKLMIETNLEKKSSSGTYQSVLRIPKMAFCDFSAKKHEYPLMDLTLQQLKKFGTLPLECPIQPGKYHLKQLLIPDMALPAAVFSSGDYRFHLDLTDAEAANPMVYKVTVDLKNSNGMPNLGGLMG